MLYVNSFQCCGYISRDPILENFGNSTRLKIVVALNRPGGKSPFYIDCVAWGDLAASMETRCKKGAGVFVSGELETSNFQDARGSWHKSTSIRVEKFSVLKEATVRDTTTAAVLKPPKPQL
jgi:single-stranded DNA-binding protein